MNEDSNGPWVKFDDIKELLNTARNTQSKPCSHIGDPVVFAAYRVCKKCGEVFDT